MPFYRADVEAYDAMLSELDPENLPEWWDRPSGAWEYGAAQARFEPAELGTVAQVILAALRGAGATGFRVRYDGGYDEGFAHPDALLFGEEARTAEAVLPELETPELVDRIRDAGARNSAWGNAGELYAKASQAEAMRYGLEELMTELAVKLLGSGFGTGEGQLYGAFTADLATGEIVDDPHAVKPEEEG